MSREREIRERVEGVIAKECETGVNVPFYLSATEVLALLSIIDEQRQRISELEDSLDRMAYQRRQDKDEMAKLRERLDHYRKAGLDSYKSSLGYK